MDYLASAERRFCANVDVRGPDDCWPWTGTPTAKGYGQISVGPRGTARSVRAHRMAYERVHGAIPPGLDVCHTCDNPPCCNPRHLFAGTKAENQADKRRKGRAAKGEDNRGGGKLTEDDVRAIRIMLDSATKAAIAARFGVTRQQIDHIASGRQWTHVR
jgi:hypothetical protein